MSDIPDNTFVATAEDLAERRMFDSMVEGVETTPLGMVALTLTIWSTVMPNGSMARQCVVMANEVRRAAVQLATKK